MSDLLDWSAENWGEAKPELRVVESRGGMVGSSRPSVPLTRDTTALEAIERMALDLDGPGTLRCRLFRPGVRRGQGGGDRLRYSPWADVDVNESLWRRVHGKPQEPRTVDADTVRARLAAFDGQAHQAHQAPHQGPAELGMVRQLLADQDQRFTKMLDTVLSRIDRPAAQHMERQTDRDRDVWEELGRLRAEAGGARGAAVEADPWKAELVKGGLLLVKDLSETIRDVAKERAKVQERVARAQETMADAALLEAAHKTGRTDLVGRADGDADKGDG